MEISDFDDSKEMLRPISFLWVNSYEKNVFKKNNRNPVLMYIFLNCFSQFRLVVLGQLALIKPEFLKLLLVVYVDAYDRDATTQDKHQFFQTRSSTLPYVYIFPFAVKSDLVSSHLWLDWFAIFVMVWPGFFRWLLSHFSSFFLISHCFYFFLIKSRMSVDN